MRVLPGAGGRPARSTRAVPSPPRPPWTTRSPGRAHGRVRRPSRSAADFSEPATRHRDHANLAVGGARDKAYRAPNACLAQCNSSTTLHRDRADLADQGDRPTSVGRPTLVLLPAIRWPSVSGFATGLSAAGRANPAASPCTTIVASPAPEPSRPLLNRGRASVPIDFNRSEGDKTPRTVGTPARRWSSAAQGRPSQGGPRRPSSPGLPRRWRSHTRGAEVPALRRMRRAADRVPKLNDRAGPDVGTVDVQDRTGHLAPSETSVRIGILASNASIAVIAASSEWE